MKKTMIALLIILVLQNCLFAEENINFETSNEKITLPKIPIYLQGDISAFDISNSNLFIDKKQKESFGSLKCSKNMHYKKNSNRFAWISIIGSSILIGGFIGNKFISIDKEEVHKSQKRSQLTLGGGFWGGFLGFLGSVLYVDKRLPKEQYFVSYSEGNSKKFEEKIKIFENSKISGQIIDRFLLKANKKYRRYKIIMDDVSKYNESFNSQNIEKQFNQKFALLHSPKSEFETTLQYKDRIRREDIQHQELQAEMMQKIKYENEKYKINHFSILRNIREEIDTFNISKNFDFTLSEYNADKQQFIVKIVNAKEERNLILPIDKAKDIRENTGRYFVQKTFKPYLNGEWKIVNDDFVFVNSKNNEVIPWDGENSLYSKISVINAPKIEASVELIEPSGEGYLDSEEIATIIVTLTNSGEGVAKKVRISLFQKNGQPIYYDVSKIIDEIQPNQSITSDFKLTIPENIKKGKVDFVISFLEEQGFEPEPLKFSAQTRDPLKPNLKIVDFGVDDSNKDGRISKGETVDITLRIQNIGNGKAKQVVLNIIENKLDNVFIISEKHFELKDIESGESKDVIFSLSTNNRVNDIIDINFNIQEERPQFSINEKITLEIEKTQKQLEPIVFSGKDVERKIEYSNDLSIDIEQNIPVANKSNKNALAIIFGIEDYRNVSKVNFAFRDATIMKEYYSKTLGIPEEQIYFRANDEVTLGEFRKIFSKNGWLDKRVIENETDIYFYYAGHGAPAIKEEKAFLIPFDGDPNYPVQTGYSLETVFENLSKLKANSVTVFLDACFTGANRENEMLLADARPVSIQLKNNYVKNVTVFSATSNNEISSSYPINKHGLFSYFLMKGMQGEADTNNDNKLTINELFNYTKKNVSRIAGTLDREQTPQLECLEPEKIIINY